MSPWDPGRGLLPIWRASWPAGGHPAGTSGVHHPHQDGGAAGGWEPQDPRGADLRVVRSILVAWLATFPGCMALGYGLARAALARWG